MPANRIHQQVDRIAELLAFVATYDAETLENLQSWFCEISRLARETAQPQVAVVAAAAARVAERLSLEDDCECYFMTSPINQEGGSLLNSHPDTDPREAIRGQLMAELMNMAVAFRIPGEDEPGQDSPVDDRATLAV